MALPFVATVVIRPESFKPCIGFKDEFYRRDLYRAQNLYLVQIYPGGLTVIHHMSILRKILS